MSDQLGGWSPTRGFEGFDEPFERRQWFLSTRVNTEGKVPTGMIAKASAQRRRQEREAYRLRAKPGGPGSVNWTPIGPSVVARGQPSGRLSVSGRITALAVGPGGSRIYAGAANGGTWFSSDSGTSWTPLDDYSTSPRPSSPVEDDFYGADSLAIGALAVSFGDNANTDTIFVGTGEPSFSGDAYFGIGIRFSPSSGTPGSWSLEGINLAGHAIYRIIIDPTDSTLVYAATSHGLYQRPTGSNVTEWNLVDGAFTDVNRAVTDLIVAGRGQNKCYYAAFRGDRVYQSLNGIEWKPLGGLSSQGDERIDLAASESDPPVVYALTASGKLYRLVGGSFQQVSGVPKALFFGGKGNYDMVLAVDPVDASTVYMGGNITWDQGDWALSLYKGTIISCQGSYTFPFNSANDLFTNDSGGPDSSRVSSDPTWIGRDIHPDVHALAFATNVDGTHNGTIVWVGCDGGLFQSTMSGTRGSFTPCNMGLSITEMTNIAQHPDTDAVLFGSCQDNGALCFRGEQVWSAWLEGDGGGVAVDPHNPRQVMQQSTRGDLWTSTEGGASPNKLNFPPVTILDSPEQQDAAKFENDHTNFYAPIVTSPPDVLSTLAAFGTYRLWLTSDWGSTWITLPSGTNPYSYGIPNREQDKLDDYSPICAIAFASGMRIFAATQDNVWRFDCTGNSWTRRLITAPGLPPNPRITRLAVDIDDPSLESVYLTLGGHGQDHLWHFDGDAWRSALSTTIIDAPAHAVVVDPAKPQHVYVGTDVGCWHGSKTSSSSWSWEVFSQGLPESAITDLGIHPLARLLRAATHGRGVWEIRLDDTVSMDPDIYMRVNYADTGRLQNGTRFPWVEGIQDPIAPCFLASRSMSPDIKVRRGSVGGLQRLSCQPNFLEFATIIGDQIDQTANIEIADARGTNRIFIQVHNRGLTPVAGDQVQVLLLLADASIDLPALPTDYATHINAALNAADTNSTWLAGTRWSFADPILPYRKLPGTLDVRTPQVVEYDVDFSTLSIPAGHNRVCAAAFVTSTIPAEQLSSTNTNLDQLTMEDKHVVFRTLLLL